MNTLRIGSVLLLGLFVAGMSGLTIARDRPGGQGGHGGSGGNVRYGGYGGHSGSGGNVRYGGYGGHGNVGVRVVVDPFWFTPGYYPGPYYYPRPYYSPYYYPYASPYYYPPAVVTVPTEPPVYIERGTTAEPGTQNSAAWYYCANPQGYYPYVKQCPGGWQAVAPRPPASPDEGR